MLKAGRSRWAQTRQDARSPRQDPARSSSLLKFHNRATKKSLGLPDCCASVLATDYPLLPVREQGREIRERICKEHIAGGFLWVTMQCLKWTAPTSHKCTDLLPLCIAGTWRLVSVHLTQTNRCRYSVGCWWKSLYTSFEFPITGKLKARNGPDVFHR